VCWRERFDQWKTALRAQGTTNLSITIVIFTYNLEFGGILIGIERIKLVHHEDVAILARNKRELVIIKH
jgi:hypothetical protein